MEAQVGERKLVDHEDVQAAVEVELAAAAAAAVDRTAGVGVVEKAGNGAQCDQREVEVAAVALQGLLTAVAPCKEVEEHGEQDGEEGTMTTLVVEVPAAIAVAVALQMRVWEPNQCCPRYLGVASLG